MTKSDRTEEEEKSDQEGKSNCASERQRERDGASNETARRRNVGPVPVFLDRTYAMVDEKSSAEIVAWGALGDTFVIKRLDLFEEEVIPRFFNHRNLFSFVRQLNNHGEYRMTGSGSSPVRTQAPAMKRFNYVLGR